MRAGDRAARFLGATRARILELLRRSNRTVGELAESLEVTDNAIRAHLATLERVGLVRQVGTRRGFRKPHHAYALAPEAEVLFPKPYGTLLQLLLSELKERMPPEELDAMLVEVGRRAAASHLPGLRGLSIKERVAKALEVLESMGGLAEARAQEGRLVIEGYSCPLSEAVPDHPEVCRLAEAMLTEVVGAPVRAVCDRGGEPRCKFEVSVGPEGERRADPASRP